ncbi:MAG TPA: hypothetical protein VFH97_06995, partial [Gemmatimonadales bacterium]|nr:hypothetical protein [Gemmatimonadales bacterium]
RPADEIFHRQADFASQMVNYFQYFSWQFGRDWPTTVRNVLATVFGLIGLGGAAVHWKKERRAAAAMTALMLTVTVILVWYLNFRYGFSIRPGEALDREVRERDYFFVASFQLWGLWVALGLGALWAALRSRLQERARPGPAWAVTGPVLLVAFIPLFGNRLTAPRSDERLARDFASDLLQSVEPYGILITAGDNDLFPLWYAQEVEGIRRDVTVLNQSLMNTTWHVKQILRRPLEPFDLENAAAPYRDMDLPMPRSPVLDLQIGQVDSLPLLWRVDRRSQLRLGELVITLEPGTYDMATYITLQAIRDNLGKRPIYFAQTTGGSADQLGLGDYLLGQGFVRRVMQRPLEASDHVARFQRAGWMDLERTERLLFEVYHPESAARQRPRGWLDVPSGNIMSLYYFTYALFGEITALTADSTDGERARVSEVARSYATRILQNSNP